MTGEVESCPSREGYAAFNSPFPLPLSLYFPLLLILFRSIV